MADFKSWSHDNLVRFCEEYADDRNKMLAANIALANDKAIALQALRSLSEEYARVCDEFCLRPERHDAYRAAKLLIGG